MGLTLFDHNNIQIASEDEMLDAKLFGKDISVISEGYILEAYQYQNKIFIIRYEKYIEKNGEKLK